MRLIIKLIKFLEDLTLLTLRIFPAETAKNIPVRLLKIIYNLNLISLFASGNIKKSKRNIKNLSLKNRIGIAGGLDKNAEYESVSPENLFKDKAFDEYSAIPDPKELVQKSTK